MSDLPRDLVEEILFKVLITSLRAVRATCKRWNSLSKDPSFTKKHCAKEKEFMVIMMHDCEVCLLSVNFHKNKDLIDPQSIKRIGIFNQVEIFRAFHCDGLLLCLTAEDKLVVWNPYLGQTRWIKPITTYSYFDIYGIGYDNNNNHKILRVPFQARNNMIFSKFPYNVNHEIYDFKSNSWRVLTGSLSIKDYKQEGISLKGNTYFLIQPVDKSEWFLHCFDYTIERFGPPLHLPFHNSDVCVGADGAALSVVREEQLAVLYHRRGTSKLELWITNKIESNAVSWNKFLTFDTETITNINIESFFVDEEKEVAVICGMYGRGSWLYKSDIIIGEDGYVKEVDIGVDFSESIYDFPIVCSYYVPSLVQITTLNSTVSLLRKKRKSRWDC